MLGAALERSGVLAALLKRVSDKIGSFTASDVTFALDGMARLRMLPGTPLMDALANKVQLVLTHNTPLKSFCDRQSVYLP